MAGIATKIGEIWRTWQPSSGITYLITFLLFAFLLWSVQEANNRDLERLQQQAQREACDARNELRGQFASIQQFDTGLRGEFRDFLVLRLAGDRSKIAEGVGPLRQTVRDLDSLKQVPLIFERCESG